MKQIGDKNSSRFSVPGSRLVCVRVLGVGSYGSRFSVPGSRLVCVRVLGVGSYGSQFSVLSSQFSVLG
jgi:hypothetical protein